MVSVTYRCHSTGNPISASVRKDILPTNFDSIPRIGEKIVSSGGKIRTIEDIRYEYFFGYANIIVYLGRPIK